MPRKRQPPPKRCPHCGALVPAERPACAECGSDAETGWSEDGLSGYSAADIPDAFTDEDYLDLVSGVRDARQEEDGPGRQLLHCARLVFPDPAAEAGPPVEVAAPLPVDFDI